MRRLFFIACCAFFVCGVLLAEPTTGFYRYPALHGDHVVDAGIKTQRVHVLHGLEPEAEVLQVGVAEERAQPENHRAYDPKVLAFHASTLNERARSRSVDSREGQAPMPEGV